MKNLTKNNTHKALLPFCLLSLTIALFSCGNDSSTGTCDGKEFCFMFVSVTTTDGDLDADNNGNGITEADALCNADVNKTNTSIYKALIVDGTNRQACDQTSCLASTANQLDWALAPSQEYRQTDGTFIIGTTNTYDTFNFSLDNQISVLAGTSWTGLGADFQNNSLNCSLWNSIAGSGNVGNHSSLTSAAINAGSITCGLLQTLICVEQLN